jgi:hypothetical protein
MILSKEEAKLTARWGYYAAFAAAVFTDDTGRHQIRAVRLRSTRD